MDGGKVMKKETFIERLGCIKLRWELPEEVQSHVSL